MIHKILIRSAIVLLVCGGMTFLPGFPCNAAMGQSVIIGAQITLLEQQSEEDRRYLFAQLRTSGFNTIILRVFQNSTDRHHQFPDSQSSPPSAGVYFQTSLVPVVNDLLPSVCADAHAEGLRVFAWMTTLHANYNHPELPQSHAYNPSSGQYQATGALDPGARCNQNFLTALFQDLAANPIDGILFQDDLTSRHTVGFLPDSSGKNFLPKPQSLYQFNDHGTKIAGYQPSFWQWTEKKARGLQSLANALMAACRQVNPELQFAQNINYEVLLTPQWGQAWFSQTCEALGSSTADYFFIMAYQQQIYQELALGSEKELHEIMARLFKAGERLEKGRQRVIFKLQAVDWHQQKPETVRTLTGFLQLLKAADRQSVILMPYNTNLFARTMAEFTKQQVVFLDNRKAVTQGNSGNGKGYHE
ncbi:MAG: hypothetical protein JXO49_11430 [Deltaproteobacteria bacterium]|nr:hypothetical protein [Candidatus Anaeroferrophillus wilburensis]MBN2889946.1 hypothetical protein [Deltaproteobacteria bacterium]